MPNNGDYVCVRSKDQGVVWGFLVWAAGNCCRLSEPRQQFSWDRNALTLMDVVMSGPEKTGLHLSIAGIEIDMTEVCGVYSVPPSLVEEFRTHPAG